MAAEQLRLLRGRKPKPPRESAVLRAVLDVLRLHGVWHSRLNTGAFKTNDGRFIRYGCGRGTADVLAIVRGRAVMIEVKRPGEKARPEQLAWGESVVRAGAVYRVISDPWEVVALLKELDGRG